MKNHNSITGDGVAVIFGKWKWPKTHTSKVTGVWRKDYGEFPTYGYEITASPKKNLRRKALTV
jgi:hypothetical protein